MSLIERVRQELCLSDKRRTHTEGVVKAALLLARNHFPSLSEEEVTLAALLHDYTKECKKQEQLALCVTYGIELTDSERAAPKLLHARTASAIAKAVYHAPEAVCDAVRWHTTGRPDMTGLETVIYLADYIEENRTYPPCIALREFYLQALETEADPDEALRKTLVRSFDTTIRDLLEDGKTIDRYTVEARNFYVQKGLTI